ncbi:AGC family protein kinase [Trichomonas vaginalis G3]|uniref:AGC family protein kinase n=1 Tax=Trichomonas vaginalis (strain ATCC PRA-98 / G3) TaxID=412133 RepID=A2D9C1_TRIV3|nr:STKc AGC domain-containing protein [Trichomonas vaginalis G3]EAY23147.1 AGC family protein kinase [Trichomonas vaginalis G3]KAI5513786.1 STKc AGC domain-containing protein [Trichomonas vaginalis G3]|eukprot:XP_001584133.1 AGC family protein kinase [Trichomonas vaginalis G3]
MSETKLVTSGWLKRHRFLAFWAKRYCVLTGTDFCIYKSEDLTSFDFHIEILPTTTIEIIDEVHDPRFRIIDNMGKENVFETPNTEMLMRWVLALRGCTLNNPQLKMSDFRVLKVIGRGFYGKVTLCEHIATKEIVAIKSIHKSRLIQQNKVTTVISERNILAKAQHPFIVNLKFAFQSPSKFYLGLEYVPGGELFFHMQRYGNIRLDDCKIYIAEILLALNHLHSLGVIYRDLKPENILLDANGHIKLTDFGLSKNLAHEVHTSTFCGTTEYLAPEVVNHQPYTYSVDWWALGVLTYELLFGTTPFAHQNRAKMFRNILDNEPQFPPNFNQEAIDFIKAMLTKDPLKRPTFEQIKQMKFFQNLNWDDVLQKKIQPKFVPASDNSNEANNFDPEFTSEQAADSYVMPVFGSAEKLAGFSYVDQSFEEEYNESDAISIGSSYSEPNGDLAEDKNNKELMSGEVLMAVPESASNCSD